MWKNPSPFQFSQVWPSPGNSYLQIPPGILSKNILYERSIINHFLFVYSDCINPSLGFLVALMVKNPPSNAGDIRKAGWILGSGRSPGGGHGNLLQHSYPENPMDRVAWWATVHGLTKCQTWLKQLSWHACNPLLSCYAVFVVKALSIPLLFI